MAQRIDRTFGFVVLLAAGFFLFRFATDSLPFALFLTAALGCLIRACYRAWQARYGRAQGASRERTRGARALVERWAACPDERAAEKYVKARYAESEPYSFVLLARHPAGRALDANDLLEVWRSHADTQRLVAAATGPVDPAAQMLADTLSAPRVRLLDGGALISAICLSGLDIPSAPAARRKPRLPRIVPSKKRAPLCVAYALFMLAAYWILGAPAYLLAALLLIALAVLGLKKSKPPETLFR